MFSKFLEIWKEWCERGVRFPYAFDPVENGPSITLLFPYVTFIILVSSLIALHFNDGLLKATLVTFFVWSVSVIFYRLRKLDKVKIDIDDQSIELESEKEETK